MHKNTTTHYNQTSKSQPTSTPLNQYAPYGDQYLYISSWKVLFMTLFIPSYFIIWVWRNWRIYRSRQRSNKGVFWRTVFYPFMLYPLFNDMFSMRPRAKTEAAILMASCWLPGITLHFFKLIHPSDSPLIMLIGLIPFLIFPVAQLFINRHAQEPVDKHSGYKFQHMSWLNYLGVGIIIFLLYYIYLS